MFSVGYQFIQISCQELGSIHVEFLLRCQKMEWDLANDDDLSFLFYSIVGPVRCCGIFCQEREDTKCSELQNHEQLAAVFDRALELADSSGNSSCLLLYTVDFHLLFERVFQLHNKISDLYYHCVGSSNTILSLKKMYYSTCRWRYTLPNTHELNI